jgi:hypothetical protein
MGVDVDMESAAQGHAKERARDYLRMRGTRATPATIRARTGEAFTELASFLAEAPTHLAGRRAWPDEWSVQEIVDHLLETHRPGLDELWCLLAGRRPPGEPIPAGLQSKAPLLRPWSWLRNELARLHDQILSTLADVPAGFETLARAPLVMVVNIEGSGPLEWVEELDWKAYAIVWRLHAIDHLHQARKVLAALA